jgi:hypothetical protein
MTVEYLIAGAVLAAIGSLRLVLEGAWRRPGRAGLLGYGGLLFGVVLLVAGFAG